MGRSETRLDKRAELIKERRYGGLAVANDPKLAFPDDAESPPEAPPKDSNSDKEPPLAKSNSNDTTGTSSAASTNSARQDSHSRASSATQLSGDSGSSKSKARRQPISIADLRAEAQTGGPIKIQDGDELAKSMAATLELDSNGSGALMDEPDFESDDSDVPPSEEGQLPALF